MPRYLSASLWLILGLLLFGVWRVPAALRDPLGLAADILILVAYGLIFRFWLPRLEQQAGLTLRAALAGGLLAGLIFVLEMLLEYIFLPADNTAWGAWEYGSVLVTFFSVSVGVAAVTNQFRQGLSAAVVSALIASLLWLMAVHVFLHVFLGTAQQAQVFRAEGNLDDFARSGMSDLAAFILQDFWGAGFFHSILLPLFAALLGSLGSLVGLILGWLRRRFAGAFT